MEVDWPELYHNSALAATAHATADELVARALSAGVPPLSVVGVGVPTHISHQSDELDY